MERLKKLGLAAMLILGISLASCEMLVEVDMPEHTPKLALRYMLGNDVPDSTFYAFFPGYQLFVSHSLGILDTLEIDGVNTATVEITDASGRVVETFQSGIGGAGVVGNGYYQPVNNFTAVPGQTYTLKATAPGFEAVTASLTLPSQISGLRGTYARTETQPYGEKGKVTITLPDNGAEQNYYVMYGVLLDDRLAANNRDVFYEEEHNDDETAIEPEFNEIHFSNNRYESRAFSDENLNGRTISLTRDVIFYIGDPNKRPKYLRVILHSITRDTYRFLKSQESYNENNGNLFAEPTRVIGNLENGYGYFGGYTSTFLDIPL